METVLGREMYMCLNMYLPKATWIVRGSCYQDPGPRKPRRRKRKEGAEWTTQTQTMNSESAKKLKTTKSNNDIADQTIDFYEQQQTYTSEGEREFPFFISSRTETAETRGSE